MIVMGYTKPTVEEFDQGLRGLYEVAYNNKKTEKVHPARLEAYYRNQPPSRQHYSIQDFYKDDKSKGSSVTETEEDSKSSDSSKSDSSSSCSSSSVSDICENTEDTTDDENVELDFVVYPHGKKVWLLSKYPTEPMAFTVKKALKGNCYTISNISGDFDVSGKRLMQRATELIEPLFYDSSLKKKKARLKLTHHVTQKNPKATRFPKSTSRLFE